MYGQPTKIITNLDKITNNMEITIDANNNNIFHNLSDNKDVPSICKLIGKIGSNFTIYEGTANKNIDCIIENFDLFHNKLVKMVDENKQKLKLLNNARKIFIKAIKNDYHNIDSNKNTNNGTLSSIQRHRISSLGKSNKLMMINSDKNCGEVLLHKKIMESNMFDIIKFKSNEILRKNRINVIDFVDTITNLRKFTTER